MKTKHTKGPWMLHPKAISGAYQITGQSENSLRICTVTNAPNDDANARLLAAAPDLLAALQFVAKFYQDSFDAMPVAFQTVDDIVTAAIEKATKD